MTAASPPARPLVLASASPRRRELLATICSEFTVAPSLIDEHLGPGEIGSAVMALALAKAQAIARGQPEALVLGADTVVVLAGEVLGKPRDAADAARMLRRLGGRTHEVVTGVAIVAAGAARQEALAVTSRVTMLTYGDEEITAYVATGEPLDKAGAYAVQGAGGRLVAHVEGCYSNVVGLPVSATRRLLERFGVSTRPAP